jgi:AcrR family transcriptional regulator
MTAKPQDPKEARRQEILDAALAAFSEKGFDKTSMDDVVRASGLSKGTLYWYFDNKQSLFAALVERMFKEMDVVFAQTLVQVADQSPAEKLVALSAGVISTMLAPEFSHLVRLYVDFFMQAWQYPEVQQALAEMYDMYIEMACQIIREGIEQGVFRPVDPEPFARAIGGAVDGLMFQYLVVPDADFQRPTEALADIILHGLVKGETDG